MNQLAEKIAAETRERGAISFCRFMELALYCPVYGYYEKEGDKIGRRGDFYTSVSVGSLFGRLLACQFAAWLMPPKSEAQCQVSTTLCHGQGQPNDRVRLIEAGAHRGDLALDILSWLQVRRPALFRKLEYVIWEPSDARQRWQRQTLSAFGQTVHWARTADELQGPESTTVLFCNELLDSFPLHRLGWDRDSHSWFEWGVAVEREKFKWVRMPDPPAELEEWVAESRLPLVSLTDVLPDGFTVEISPRAVAWWRQAAGLVRRGKLVTLDYGGTADELLIPERPAGTLRAYRHQRHSPDPLEDPGEQDLTAHVNFTAIEHAGLTAGLRTEAFLRQEQFLTSIVSRIVSNELEFAPWTPEDTRHFGTLTHPEHLGRSFRVLIQSR